MTLKFAEIFASDRLSLMQVPPRRILAFQAFTLIEILVVVVIIGILAALILPALGKMERKAGTTKATANVRQVYAVFGMYATDHDSEWPVPKSASGLFWSKDALFPYTKNGEAAASWDDLAGTIFTSPNAPAKGKKDNPAAPTVSNASNQGFGMNALLPSADGDPYQGTYGGYPERRTPRAVRSQNLARQMLLMESNAPQITGTPSFRNQFTTFVKNRNAGKNIVLFCDGHSELIEQARFDAGHAQPLMPWNAAPNSEASIFWRGY